ncbi:hypothetical protein GOP47_0000256 [Adiantum capillus-veneris]|uniref:Uncharacterized protein n=1 Tax=Adiantum capillus-veneris TaxID=13818 RepID=A0A9D4VET3_ADICA|nr:hypothetical protein GOP47_0000256 [Adiantum capillus-veneris]
MGLPSLQGFWVAESCIFSGQAKKAAAHNKIVCALGGSSDEDSAGLLWDGWLAPSLYLSCQRLYCLRIGA